MDLQRLYGLTRKAVDRYNMIEDGDKIAIGISGGKDSLTLLFALAGLRKFYPKRFEIEAVSVDVGFGMDFSKVEKLCAELEVGYTLVHTQIKDIVFDEMKDQNPCSFCAKMRKGALNDEIKRLGCNKVAYGHHKDDAVNTMLLSLIYEGRFSSFLPVTYLDGADISIIRPLILINEFDIIGFNKKYSLPVVHNLCPVDKKTKREYVSNLLKEINSEAPGAKDRMYSAVEDFYKDWYEKYPEKTDKR